MKKFLSLILAVIMCFSLFTFTSVEAATTGFKDVPASYWAYDEITGLTSAKIVSGYDGGLFKPAANVTREEFAKMVVLTKKLTPITPATPTFKDVPATRWSYGYVEAAAKAGYVTGVGDGKFAPTSFIKRQDLAVLLVRATNQTAAAAKVDEVRVFANDELTIPKYAVGAMTIAVQPTNQFLKWDDERNIRPAVPATRAECAFALYNVLKPISARKSSINIAEENAPENFFPVISDSGYTAKAVTYLYGATIGVTPKNVAYPDMCLYVPSEANGHLIINKDGTVISDFQLRKGLKWSDGKPVTVADEIMGYDLYMSDKVQVVSRAPYDKITKIEKVNDLTLRVYWKEWDPYIVTGLPIYPDHILRPIFSKDEGAINTCDYNNNPIHCGPYIIKTNVAGAYTTMVPNPYWYGGTPAIKNITVQYITDTNTLLINMLTGQMDICSEGLTLADGVQVSEKMGNKYTVVNNPTSNIGELVINLDSEWFKDVRARQAWYYGIDRKLLSLKGMVGLDAAYSCIPACSIYYEPVLAKYNYDPDKANQLLDAAGWKWNAAHTQRVLPSGKPAVLDIPYSEGATFREREVTIIEPMLAKIGIKVNHNPTDFDKLLDSETAGSYDISLHSVTFPTFDISSAITGWLSTEIPTPANGMQGQNVQRYANPKIDKIINEIKVTRDTTKLKELYHEFQTIWAEDVPNIFLEQRMYPDVVNRELKGFDHSFAGTVYFSWNAPWWYWKS